MTGVERERKLRTATPVDPAAVAQAAMATGFVVASSSDAVHHDRYLDTAEGHLARADLALRLRTSPAGSVLCVKRGAGPGDEPFLARDEHEVAVDDATLPSRAAELPPVLRAHVEPWTFARPLVVRMALDVDRVVHDVMRDGARAEICVDRVTIAAGANPRSPILHEIEIEHRAGPDDPLVALADELQTRFAAAPSREDKLRAALIAVGEPLHEPAEGEPLTFAMPIEAAAFATFRRFFRAVQSHEAGTRLQSDVEDLHRIRVAVRKLRAAMRAFAGALPEGVLAPHRKLLGDTGRALGPARDLDVLLANLERLRAQVPDDLHGGLDEVADALREERAREQERMLKWLTTDRRLRAFARFEDFLARGPRERADGLQLRQVAPGLVLQAAHRVFRRGRRLTPADPAERYHQLRIDCKRLRYLLEVFRPLVGNELDAVLQRLARLQGVLGEFNDSDVAVRWLDAWTAKRGRRFARTTLISVGAVIGAYAAQGRLALERFPDFWRRFSRARHRRRLQDVWLRSW